MTVIKNLELYILVKQTTLETGNFYVLGMKLYMKLLAYNLLGLFC